MKLPLLPLGILLASAIVSALACRAPMADAQTNYDQQDASRPQGLNPLPSPLPKQGTVFGKGWKLASKPYKDVSHQWKYRIKGAYPQIGNSDDPRALELNQKIKRVIAEQFTYVTTPDPKEIQEAESLFPREDPLEMVDFDYEILLATEDLLSVRFSFEEYSRGAAHPIHGFFTANYEVQSGKGLSLSDIFKPESDYLTVISRSCAEKIGVTATKGSPWEDAVSPKEKNFERWNMTKEGLAVSFDQCIVMGCAGGTLTVVIPYEVLREYLKPDHAVFRLAA